MTLSHHVRRLTLVKARTRSPSRDGPPHGAGASRADPMNTMHLYVFFVAMLVDVG